MGISEKRDMEIIFDNPAIRHTTGIDPINATPEQEEAFQNWKRKNSLPLGTMTVHPKHNLQHYVDYIEGLV